MWVGDSSPCIVTHFSCVYLLKVRDSFCQQNTTKQDDTLLRSRSESGTHLHVSRVRDSFFVRVSLKSSRLILSAKYH